ncbi:MAG: 2-oxo acid dehydrogenase subunit E2 [Candidatus Rokubacteria bacterium]|nr:2-oxo acid dehydrogenase subunit E2 [Candidatus Rokubacteria bacterium]
MPREFRLPDLGEGLTEAEVIRVLVSEGDLVREDQVVVEVETDKAQVELPSPVAGRVARVHVKPGEAVKVGSVLITFDGAEAEPRGVKLAPPSPAAAPPRPAPVEGRRPPVAATPAMRRVARELGVDLSAVTGTGPGGRITEADIRAAAGRVAPTPVGPALRPPDVEEPSRPLALPRAELPPLPRFEQWGAVEREPIRSVRRRTAEHMALAWAVIPHVTHFDEADITYLEAMRRRQEAVVPKLTLTVLLLKAAALTLQAHPRFNASLDHERGELVLKRYYHLGVAVDSERGLVVPVVRDVDKKRIPELAGEVAALVERTRAGKVSLEDLRGGTFTVTNTGRLGGTAATPIINYPEVAILGVARARELPVVRNGEIVPRLILALALSFDHRVLDGADAARFMTDLVRLLEDPERLLLEV